MLDIKAEKLDLAQFGWRENRRVQQHAVYAFHGDPLELATVIGEVTPLVSGGTLAVFLLAQRQLVKGIAMSGLKG